jgi:hypothetical protein
MCCIFFYIDIDNLLKKNRSLFIFFFFLIPKIFLNLGYLFMDELSRAVEQFLPVSSGSRGGSFNPQPDPSATETLLTADSQSSSRELPGSSGRQDGPPRDYIAELLDDKSLEPSFRNSLIHQESISILMSDLIKSQGLEFSESEIRKGVDLYFTDDMMKPSSYRNPKFKRIISMLTEKGITTSYYKNILADIEQMRF